jgi:hypothetical protein
MQYVPVFSYLMITGISGIYSALNVSIHQLLTQYNDHIFESFHILQVLTS